MGREEQIEEREVLESIFPDEITGTICASHSLGCKTNTNENTDISETEYRVSIQLEVVEENQEEAPEPRNAPLPSPNHPRRN